MAYPSVDQLQKVLTESVFSYAKDSKKAAGRALGMLVEVVTFYLLTAWGLEKYIAIERRLPEYSNEDITHNVEYSLHPSTLVARLKFGITELPISVAKIAKALLGAGKIKDMETRKSHQLLSSQLILRNACTIAETGDSLLVASLEDFTGTAMTVAVHRLHCHPYAIAECKRVGVEEGTKKGPQTIEKAKQGAYVARTISSLQRIRLATGEIGGVIHRADGTLQFKMYGEFLEEVIASDDKDLLEHFILTVGVVSNHGNWFTSDDHNKELKVLAQSYDWLLFLTDKGLGDFVTDLITAPSKEFEPVRDAFLVSYTGKSGSNQFTKVQMNLKADLLLQKYFQDNFDRIQSWFNIISPEGKDLKSLHDELHNLTQKDWSKIHE